jgi:hypothetical protein
MTVAASTRIGPREIFRNSYMMAWHDLGRRLLILGRAPVHYPNIDALRETFHDMEEALAHLPRHRTALLIESRRAPARNDPEFEAEFGRLRKHFLRDWQKVATIVQTAVGVLQVSRHMRVDELPVSVFTNAAEALAYLGVSMPAEFVDHLE